MSQEETPEFLEKLKNSLDMFIAYQEMNDQQIDDFILQEETGTFYRYDFFLLSYVNLNPEFLPFVIDRPIKFIDFIQNALINFQDAYFQDEPAKTNLFKEFIIVNFKEIPFTNQIYRLMEKSERPDALQNDSSLFLECKNLFYKLIMLQGEITMVSKPRSLGKYKIHSCTTCNRGYLEENNWVIGKARFKQSKINAFTRNAGVDQEHTDKHTGFLLSEKAKCICDAKRLVFKEQILITYQEVVIRLNNFNRLVVIFEGNINENFKLGQKICITGYLINHFDKLTKGTRCEGTISMYALKYDLVANIQNEVMANEIMHDVAQPIKFIRSDIINKNRLIRSFCRKIKKKYYAKLFMLLALVSGTSYVRNNNEVRAQIHVLFTGPSGSHKFDLMKAASSVVKESKYIPLHEGLGTDLIFTMSKKDTISFEAGAFLMGNKDVTFIHDINLIHSKNKELLNDILFNQRIKKYFENANYEITIHTSIIASCEPLFRIKNKDKAIDIANSCGVAESMLNLFDAVVNLDDGNNLDEIDHQINHLIKFYTDKPPTLSKKRGGGEGEDEEPEEGGKKGKKEKELMSEAELKAYLEDCKKIQVKLSSKAYTLVTVYLKSTGENYTTSDLERVVRFTQAHAKLLGRSYATVFDVISVITVIEANEFGGLVENAKEKILIKSLNDYQELEAAIIKKLDLGEVVN